MSLCRFEDGTLPFLEILAVKHGFDTLYDIAGLFTYLHTDWTVCENL